MAGALRPYTMFADQRAIDGRVIVETAVPGSTLRAAREALDRLGRQVAIESYRASGVAVPVDSAREAA